MSSPNAAGYAALDRMLDTLRALPNLGRESAPAVATAIKSLEDEQIAAGNDPYGHAWPKGKQGQPVLANAGKAIAVTPHGTKIVIQLTGIETLHHIGAAKGYKGGSAKLGGFRRTLIPFAGLPGPFKGAIRTVLSEKFQHLKRKAGR